ncbi:DUF4296 domain-containing protein [Pontibacter sp. H259]|uniref:DUF4296 domain-containing protein n=1 Tax=Pontibacter sp. H259 TaxID=3133421 RepID=UPI0030BE4E34
MKRLFSILFCLALLGCRQQEETPKPADMVPQDKMVQILSDVHVMEALIEANVPHPDSAAMAYNKQHKAILKKYGISNARFNSTYKYYGENLQEMDRLYEIILDTLTAREAKLVSKEGGTPEVNEVELDSPPMRRKERLKHAQDVLQNAPATQ